jgi:hypothetical protein
MNERIKELSKEAETYARSICNPAGNYLNKETGEVKIFWQISRAKFAELIIQECIRLGEESQYKCRTFPVSTTIRDHFGIK